MTSKPLKIKNLAEKLKDARRNDQTQTLQGRSVIPVLQGETRVSSDETVVMTTILGSCVSACIWDPKAKVGGMNHFLLPGCEKSPDGALGYGVQAMELLVNGLIRLGASREHLKVKLLGGAKMNDAGLGIGEENANFARWFIENEGFELVDSCLGGVQGRNVRFWPVGGRIQRRFMASTHQVGTIKQGCVGIGSDSDNLPSAGDVQIF